MYMRLFTFILLVLPIFFLSCTKNEEQVVAIQEKEIDLQMMDAYQEGMEALDVDDGLTAAKKFSEAELLFPQSIWAPRAALMSAYSYYSNEYYADTIYELERFLKTYPRHPRTDYAYYLLAIAYYDQIIDETKDLDAILKAKKHFEYIVSNYPNTDFAMDSTFKLELINEVMASKEMYVARFYYDKEKWIPAINRFNLVVENYNDTSFIEEALHRLVEIHYKIGLEEEAKKYAKLLGYNYLSSEWYKKSYKVLNKNYKSPKINKKRKSSLLKKFKSLLE